MMSAAVVSASDHMRQSATPASSGSNPVSNRSNLMEDQQCAELLRWIDSVSGRREFHRWKKSFKEHFISISAKMGLMLLKHNTNSSYTR
jgi:hypothetical protein